MIAEELPPFLSGLVARLGSLFGGRGPNQALINQYEPGGGISPHGDGPLYLPTAAIVSLMSPVVLKFSEPRQSGGAAVASLWLEPNSLLVFQGDAYERLHHHIEPVLAELRAHSQGSLGCYQLSTH